MDNNQKFQFEFTLQEAQTILNAVSEIVPWKTANPIIQNLMVNVQKQSQEARMAEAKEQAPDAPVVVEEVAPIAEQSTSE